MMIVRIDEFQRSKPILLNTEQIRWLRQFEGKMTVEASDTAGHYFLRADSWVGKFTIPGLIVDVVPKIGPVDVLKMYLVGDGEASPELLSSLNRTNSESDFWDLVAELLMHITDEIIRGGIRREYVENERNSEFVVGQVVIANDIITNTPLRTGTYCRFSELTPDIAVNQAIVWGLNVLGHSVSGPVAHRMRFFTRKLEEVSPAPRVPQISYQTESGLYRTALFLVDLVSRSIVTSSSTFGLSGYGLLLDMNKVFEGYVRNTMRRVLKKQNLHIPEKSDSRTPLCKGVMLEPDFIIINRNQPIGICDCKYKVDWKYINADVFQMLAYLEGFASVKNAFVFYPSTEQTIGFLDKIDYPRSGSLFRIGIPIQTLLDDNWWSQMANKLADLVGLHFIQNRDHPSTNENSV